MEKLSIEDKAKRYDEALARANEMIKAMTNIGGVAKVDDIQHIFPELKESEDEKIRKELIAYCQVNMGHTWHNIKQEDYITWLEKQGEKGTNGNEREIPNSEQKPAWSEVDENVRQWIISDIDKLLALKKKSFIIADKEIDWLTPDQALRAVEIAREEVIDKVIGWIEEINNNHHIIRYSDSCEPHISELTEWFKNYMKEGGKDE